MALLKVFFRLQSVQKLAKAKNSLPLPMAGRLGARGLYLVVNLGERAKRSSSAPPVMIPTPKAEKDEDEPIQTGVPNPDVVQEYVTALEERADQLDFMRQLP